RTPSQDGLLRRGFTTLGAGGVSPPRELTRGADAPRSERCETTSNRPPHIWTIPHLPPTRILHKFLAKCLIIGQDRARMDSCHEDFGRLCRRRAFRTTQRMFP